MIGRCRPAAPSGAGNKIFFWYDFYNYAAPLVLRTRARLHVKFLDTIGVFKRGNAMPYEVEPGRAGVAVPYASTDSEVTIYVRALGADTYAAGIAELLPLIFGITP
jgi:hypothetical protein